VSNQTTEVLEVENIVVKSTPQTLSSEIPPAQYELALPDERSTLLERCPLPEDHLTIYRRFAVLRLFTHGFLFIDTYARFVGFLLYVFSFPKMGNGSCSFAV